MGNALALLAHGNALVRGALAWGIGVGLALGAWAAAYRLLPEQSVSAVSLAKNVPLDLAAGTGSLALTIFAWNAAFGGGTIVLASLFRVGRLPLGFVAPWAWCVAFGLLLGTNSFAFPSPMGKTAPQLGAALQHVGLRELSAYLLLAAALANAHLWRYRSWWDPRLERVRRLAEVRLSPVEAACLVLGVSLLAWSAVVEAAQLGAVLG